MLNFIEFIKNLVSLYMYYVGIACFLSWIPNINPNYPLFHFIFKSSGFFLIPPFFGFIFTPMLIMAICYLIIMGLTKVEEKINKDKMKDIIVLSPEEFFAKLEQEKLKQEKENLDVNNDNSSSNK